MATGTAYVKELWDGEQDLDQNGLYVAHRFVLWRRSITSEEFEQLLDACYGSETDEYYAIDDPMDPSMFPAYTCHERERNGLIVATGSGTEWYGHEVLAFWVPDGFDLDTIKEDLRLWSMARPL